MTFQELGLKTELLQALTVLGFETPTPIQEQSIPQILSSEQDIIALAQTGTGKTAAFSLPILHQIDPDAKEVQTLILCPTRELCLQITRDIMSYTKQLPGVNAVAIYGGDSMTRQMRALAAHPQIVVGTPGRLRDMIKRRKLVIDTIKWLVIDEADEMLNLGFKEELDEILETTPKKKQTLLFSATMAPSIDRIAKQYMHDPLQIQTATRNEGSDNVEHIYYMTHARDRYEALRRVVDMHPSIYGIIFCRTKNETRDIAAKLALHNYSSEAIHGDLSQEQREKVMQRFRKKEIQLLVATDVAARGIDVKELTHVINYNLPDQIENYVHRSGRTGRAHSKGISIALINMREMGRVRAIERHIKKSFEQGTLPSGKEICENRLMHLIDTVEKVHVDEQEIARYLPAIYDKLAHLDREEIIQHFVSYEFNHFLSFYKDAKDLNVAGRAGSREQLEKRSYPDDANVSFSTLSVSLGKKDRFSVKDLFNMINRHSNLRGIKVGNISINPTHTEFEIDKSKEKEVIIAFKKSHIKGKKVTVTPVKHGERSGGGKKKFGHGRRGYNNKR